jgi:hypothetical protein
MRKTLLNFIKVFGQIVLSRQAIHPWKVVNFLVRLQQLHQACWHCVIGPNYVEISGRIGVAELIFHDFFSDVLYNVVLCVTNVQYYLVFGVFGLLWLAFRRLIRNRLGVQALVGFRVFSVLWVTRVFTFVLGTITTRATILWCGIILLIYHTLNKLY